MRSVMAVLEGVLAIHKPPSISSFDVIRTITPLFRKSPLFQPLIDRERIRKEQIAKKRRSTRKDRLDELKIGHGGTLDPLATGVLIVGIGAGTKSLQQFLDGTKEYECTVLFGAATDSYDIVGKVTKTASWEGITREKVEKALDTLRGEQMQLPPVFSSIRVDGKHLYDYARQGLPLPEIKRRAVTVHELEMLEWLPPDQHSFELPSQEADHEAKVIAERITWPKSLLNKRKREVNDEGTGVPEEPPQKVVRSSPSAEFPKESTTEETVQPTNESAPSQETKATENTSSKSRPPAARIRMVVSSGFYVRSLCHDLGAALDSAGLMATLVRSRQSGFELGKNVIEYNEFEKGDEVWEPQVKTLLEDWQAKLAENKAKEGKYRNSTDRHGSGRARRDRGEKWKDRPRKGSDRRAERNTSSPEPNTERRRQRNTSSPE